MTLRPSEKIQVKISELKKKKVKCSSIYSRKGNTDHVQFEPSDLLVVDLVLPSPFQYS